MAQGIRFLVRMWETGLSSLIPAPGFTLVCGGCRILGSELLDGNTLCLLASEIIKRKNRKVMHVQIFLFLCYINVSHSKMIIVTGFSLFSRLFHAFVKIVSMAHDITQYMLEEIT